MARPVTYRRGSLLIAAAFSSLTALGCLGTEGQGDPAYPKTEGKVPAVAVSDDAFATELHRLLRDGKPSAERVGRLTGVVRRQLAHAGGRFASGHDARGLQSVVGAMYLVRAGEDRSDMLDADGDKAIAGAVDRVSARGDEGRAEVLMKMRAAFLPQGSPARNEVEAHLATLDQWTKETRTSGPMERLGSEERAAVARAMVDPSDRALKAGVLAVSAWVKRALEYIVELDQRGGQGDREETLEALRALTTGGPTMSLLYARHGNARGAIESLQQTGVLRAHEALPDRMQLPLVDFYPRLVGAAQGDGARDWLALAATFANQVPEERRLPVDQDLLAAGLFGASLEAFRRDPHNIGAGVLLSRSLVYFGMPEAAPLVLAEAIEPKPSPRAAGAAMELVMAAIADAAEAEDYDAARRTFKAAAGVLALCETVERLEPSPARARAMMASIELRAGNLPAARPLLEASVKAEPAVAGFNLLAAVERQSGNGAAALAAVEQALKAPDARFALLDVADAHLMGFEIFRDQRATDRAKGSLDSALAATLSARKMRGNASTQARAERLLGRILEGYGDTRGATRAFDRALGLASTDRPMLGAVMLEAVGRALVRRDLPAARSALKRGVEGDVAESDLVYGGLWVSLLERELKEKPDGTVERALRSGAHSPWTAKLTAWVNGKITDNDLGAAAQNVSQRVEAAFYAAMARKVAGDPSASDKLKAVATSPVIGLLEVRLARDLTAPAVRADLPGGVQLP